ncbi:MAG: hypothetical protein GY920_06310 [Aliivibrio sp.]|nr:hypothetical protein [Aliivibrio sp.]
MKNVILTDKNFIKAVNLNALRKANDEMLLLASKGFRKSVELGRLIHQAHQVIRKTDGINLKEFCNEVFGWGENSSMGNRYSKIGIATDDQVTEFESLCAEEDSKWKLTIVSFKAWLEGKEAKESNKEEVVFTLTYKGEDGNNVAVRITESGELKTSNDTPEIGAALDYFKGIYNKAIKEAKAESEAKAEAEAKADYEKHKVVVLEDSRSNAMIEKRAISQAEAEERKKANAERVERESVDNEHFISLYKGFCSSEGLKFSKAEYNTWRRDMVLAYRKWFSKSKKNNAHLYTWLRKKVTA